MTKLAEMGSGWSAPGSSRVLPSGARRLPLTHRRLFGRTAADRPGGYSSASAEVSHNRISSASSCVPDHRPNTGRASRARKPSAGQAPVAAATLNSTETEAWPSARALRSRIATAVRDRSEEHTSELQSLMRISYEVFCLKKTTQNTAKHQQLIQHT